jgi:hypothetical protein
MRNLILAIFIMLLPVSCSDRDNNSPNSGMVTIKGTISSGSGKAGSTGKAGQELSLADARKVMVFKRSKYTIWDIVDNTFSVSSDAGTANSLVFLNKDNKFIGVLCTQGLNVLPLVGLKDGDNTVIDLKTLTMPGDSVIPMHNPFGDEIDISPEEIENLLAVGSYYESLAENIDADNNGELDILTNRQVTIIFHFNIYVGNIGIDNTPPGKVSQGNYFINYGVEFAGGIGLNPVDNTATLTGPAGDECNDIFLWGFSNTNSGNEKFLVGFNRRGVPVPENPMVNNFLPFKNGIYTFTPYPGTSFTLHFSTIDARDNLIIVSPTLHTDGNGKITKVTFDFEMPDGTPVIPENLISDFMMQFINNGNQQFLVDRLSPEQGYSSYTFKTPPDLASFKGMDIFYYDLLGNYYNNNWSK